MIESNIYLLGKLYICDPSLNKECSKEGCYINGGGCYLTNNDMCKEKRLNFKLLQAIIKDNDIPEDVKLINGYGYEDDDSEMMGMWYNKEENIICFTENICEDNYLRDPKWEFLAGRIFFDIEKNNKAILEKYLKVRGRLKGVIK